jgi:hypothetical protein
MEYSYAIPAEFSHYRIRAGDEWVTTAYDGSVIADAETGQLVTLKIRTAELPPSTGSCETSTTLEYQTVRIGAGDFLLPGETRKRFVSRTGLEAESLLTFSACREYRGESTVHYGEGPSPSRAAAPAAASPSLRLPANLDVSVALTKPINTESAAAGDTFFGRLAKPIVDAQKVARVPAGTLVEGRLMRVQRYFMKPARATVVFKVEALEVNGVRVPITVLPASPGPNVEWMGKPAGPELQYRGVSLGELPMPGETKYGVFQFFGLDIVVPKGYVSRWTTAEQ